MNDDISAIGAANRSEVEMLCQKVRQFAAAMRVSRTFEG